MEPQQLSYEIHPSFLESFTFLAQKENIPFTFKYHPIKGLAGYFLVTLDKAVINSIAVDFFAEASKFQIKQDKEKMERLTEIDLDYERIRSDMKALVFYASLSQPAYKSTEKRKDIFSMLHSDLSKKLRPPFRRKIV